MNGTIQTLQCEELERIFGGVGGWPDEPTFQDLIDLSEQTYEDTLDRLTRKT